MTALLWMLTWLPYVLPATRDLPQPVNLTLTSDHFIHLLTWEPGPGMPTGVHYLVSVHSVTGSSWEPVAGCKHVQHPLVCNLTESFRDPRQTYYSRVTALLGDQTSETTTREFLPIKDTVLDLPLLTVTPCGRDLCVDLQPPMEHLREIYDSLYYTLHIKRQGADRDENFKDTKSLQGQIFKDLAPGRNYCTSVSFSDSLVPRKSNFSQPQCAFTTRIFTADVVIAPVLCILVGFGLVIVALLVWTDFICPKAKPQPAVLTSIHHIDDLQVFVPCRGFEFSHLFIKEIAPSAGEDESVLEDSAGSRGGGYTLKVPIHHLSVFPSSSSSPPSPFSPDSGALPDSSQTPNLSSDSFSSGCSCSQLSPQPISDPQPETLISADDHLTAATLHSHSLSNPHEGRQGPTNSPNTLNVEGNKAEEEEEEAMGERSSQDVNLLTLSFGGRKEEDEENPKVDPRTLLEESSCSTSPLLPSQIWDAEDVAIETVSAFVDKEQEEEEEEEEYSGYISRLRPG